MKLVIAEKPSVAREIAGAVGATDRGEGYLEGNGYVVTWCRGHLVNLVTPDGYEQWQGKWDFGKLPMVPDRWLWEPSRDSGAKAQLNVIKKLMRRGDIEAVVNACDADREGEGIFRRVAEYNGCKKPMLRMWSTSLEDAHIRADLAAAKPESDYDGLGDAAEGRAKADWLVGLNGTRAYTTLYHRRIYVGRVQTTVLAMVVERTLAHDSFKSEPFWRSVIDLGGFSAFGERRSAREVAEQEAERAKAAGRATVTHLERKTKKVGAERLYDITALQRDASTRCGLTSDATLAAAQSLYEKKLLTYPRTPSRFIGSDQRDEAEKIIAKIATADIVGAGVAAAFDKSRADVKRVVNDKKVQGHPALLPTLGLNAKAMAGLSGAERQVMLLVCARLLAAVSDPATTVTTKIQLEAGGDNYEAAGTKVIDAAWKAIDEAIKAEVGANASKDAEEESQEIPESVNEGDVLPISGVEVREGKTTPPKYFTEAELLRAMENAGRRIEDAELREAMNDDESHSPGLGTPATRAAILKLLFDRKLMRRKGKSVIATPEGIDVSEIVADTLKEPELTARWERDLSKVERGQMGLDEFLRDTVNYTKHIVSEAKETFQPSKAGGGAAATEVGTCPICGQKVLHKGGVYTCASNKSVKGDDGTWKQTEGCGFKIFAKVCGKALSEASMRAILEGKVVKVKGLKSSKTGKTFDCGIRLSDDKKDLKFVFDNNSKGGSGKRRGGARR